MAGKNNAEPSPTRKRPRLRQVNGSRKGTISRQRPPSGRSLPDGGQVTGGQRATSRHTFADLVGRGRSRAEEVLGDDAPDDVWATLTNTVDNLGSASALPATLNDQSTSRVLFEPDAGETAETMNFSGITREVTLDRLVLDLSLKTRIQISSPLSLRWALARSQKEEYEALLRILGDAANAGGEHARAEPVKNSYKLKTVNVFTREDVAKAKRRMYQALLHFRCPSGPLPAKLAADWQALTENYGEVSRQVQPSNDAQKVMVNRLLAWQDALQSLFFGYRYGYVSMFYVVLSTTTVVFSRGKPWQGGKIDTDGAEVLTDRNLTSEPCLRAGFAKASPGLRALMSNYDVPFTMVEGTDGFEEPCLVVEGDISVHKLYNFLLGMGHKISNATDVPLLLADKPFRGSTITSAEIFHARTALVPQKDGQETQERHTLQMRGLFTPRQVDGICHALSIIQNFHFEARLEAEPKGSMLNVCGHGEKEGRDQYKLRGPVVLSRIRLSPDVDGVRFSTKDA